MNRRLLIAVDDFGTHVAMTVQTGGPKPESFSVMFPGGSAKGHCPALGNVVAVAAYAFANKYEVQNAVNRQISQEHQMRVKDNGGGTA